VLFHSSGCRLKQINGDSSFSKRLSSASMLSGNWFLVNQETPPHLVFQLCSGMVIPIWSKRLV
jgi:hypothetical protein